MKRKKDRKTVALLTQDRTVATATGRALKGAYLVKSVASVPAALDFIYNSIPNLVVVDISKDAAFALPVLNNLKEDPIFKHMPILAVTDDHFEADNWDSLLIEDYVRKEEIGKDLRTRAGLCIFRSERIMEINPLTRLPGNISINRQIQNRLDKAEVFSLAYADLDHFKPFNDHYGFGRGDEVIKMTGRLIQNTVKMKQPDDSFVGHIGGDDFIFIVSADVADAVGQEIVETFDQLIPNFYDKEDQDRGFIQSKDRQGNVRAFPVITLSIGITGTRYRKFSHYGEMIQAVSEMKQHAKRFKGSCCKIDKRRSEARS